MKSSQAAISAKKGFNYGVWNGFIESEKRGKQELLNHYMIITNIADQNALQEQPHNNPEVDFLEKQCDSAMNYSAPSNVEHEEP